MMNSVPMSDTGTDSPAEKRASWEAARSAAAAEGGGPRGRRWWWKRRAWATHQRAQRRAARARAAGRSGAGRPGHALRAAVVVVMTTADARHSMPAP